MAVTTPETVYIGRNNGIDLLLKADDVVQNITVINRVQLKDPTTNTVLADSLTNPTAFDWTTQGAQGILRMFLGGILTTVATYRKADLIIYDSTNVDGLCWGNFPLRVREC